MAVVVKKVVKFGLRLSSKMSIEELKPLLFVVQAERQSSKESTKVE